MLSAGYMRQNFQNYLIEHLVRHFRVSVPQLPWRRLTTTTQHSLSVVLE